MTLKEGIKTVLYIAVGVGTLLPGLVAFLPDASSLEAFHDVFFCASRDLVILLRHRGMLLCTVGATVLYAAGHPPARPMAEALAFTNMLTYAGLCIDTPKYNAKSKGELKHYVGLSVMLIVARRL